MLGWGGFSSFEVDHTIDHFYPVPLEFVSTPITPVLNSGNQIRWRQTDTQEFFGIAVYRDPRIKVVYLPAVLK